MHTHVLVALSVLLLVGFGCQWIAWRLKLPAILFLLLSGLLAGPLLNWLHPDRLFGDLLFPFISLAVAVILSSGMQGGFSNSLAVFGKIVAIGVLLGGTAGHGFGIALRRHWVPHYLHNFAALGLVCGVFALSDLLEAESGLLSVTVMGIWLTNMKGFELDEILDFKESLSILLISMLFILLAARMDLDRFLDLGWPALTLFGDTAPHEVLAGLLAAGGEVKTTPLTDEFSYDDYRQQQDEKRIPLFALDPGGRIHPLTDATEVAPQADWKIIGLSANPRSTDR